MKKILSFLIFAGMSAWAVAGVTNTDAAFHNFTGGTQFTGSNNLVVSGTFKSGSGGLIISDTSTVSGSANSVAWPNVNSTPTTLGGYGITDAIKTIVTPYLNWIVAGGTATATTGTQAGYTWYGVAGSGSAAPVFNTATIPIQLISTGTGASQVASGTDSRITGALQKASNLSDLNNSQTAWTNLGLKISGGYFGISTGSSTYSTLNGYTFGTPTATFASGTNPCIVEFLPNSSGTTILLFGGLFGEGYAGNISADSGSAMFKFSPNGQYCVSMSSSALTLQANVKLLFSGSAAQDIGATAQPAASLYVQKINVSGGSNTLAGTFTMSSGTASIVSSAITTSTVIVTSVKTSSGTLGLYGPEVVVFSGSATVSGAATDNSTYNWIGMKLY